MVPRCARWPAAVPPRASPLTLLSGAVKPLPRICCLTGSKVKGYCTSSSIRPDRRAVPPRNRVEYESGVRRHAAHQPRQRCVSPRRARQRIPLTAPEFGSPIRLAPDSIKHPGPPVTGTFVRIGARDDRLDAAHPPGATRARHPDAGVRQGGVRQSRRFGQGSHRPRHHRGRGTLRRTQAGRRDRRRHQRQHRRRARHGGGDQGLSLHLHDARQDEPGKSAPAQGVRRRGHHHADRRAARSSRALRHEGEADRARHAGRDPRQPVLQPAQSRSALRHDRSRDLGADRRQRDPPS